MFSYLILCPSRGSSLICLAWPRVPPVPCSTAYLVPQVLLATPAFTMTSFTCPISFFLVSVSFFLFSPVFIEDSEENLSYGSLCWDWNWKRT
uniref:Uncharacterized protein n=1 Tax=Aotus nancymaae TaxID=37293 RepID=A0A2K5E413_AOTNA